MGKIFGKVVQVKPGYYQIKTRKGLDLKISGAPAGYDESIINVRRVGLLGDDYPMVKPSFQVAIGDFVKKGQVLFTSRDQPEIRFTAPAGGRVIEINRGEKRKFESIVLELYDEKNPVGSKQEIKFNKYTQEEIQKISPTDIIENLLVSGLWVSLRNRPFGIIPSPSGVPHSIFITAVDSNPHAPIPSDYIQEHEPMFIHGIEIISKLTKGKVFLVKDKALVFQKKNSEILPDNISTADISGPHPSGNVGTHIHFLDPVGPQKNVWYINYQDVISVGYLFSTGTLFTERWISISGPACTKPAFVKTIVGASIDDLVSGRKIEGDVRQVSGSLLSGNSAPGNLGFLGRYHNQVSLIEEGRQRKLLGWLSPGIRKFSSKNIYLSRMIKPDTFEFNTSTNGSKRAMVPIEIYEKIMPLDIFPVFLLRALLMGDIEQAEDLGALELEEEDMALCTFVSPGKEDFGHLLRIMLNRIQKGE